MDRLTTQQSQLLKRLFDAPASYTAFSEEEKEICRFLKEKGYVDYHEIPKTQSGDGLFIAYSEIESVSISESGKMYLINEQLSDEQRRFLKDQIDSLKNIADSAKTQADLAIQAAERAERESKIARRDALFSKITSIIAIAVSISGVIANFLTK